MPSELAELLPGPTDRAVFFGQTGSGKTTLARHMLESRDFVVVIDGKGLINWTDYQLYQNLDAAMKSSDRRYPAKIWRPSHEALRDPEALDKFFEWIYRRGNTTVYIDEVYTVTEGEQIPPFYHACLTRGREHKVETWSATQRPMRIPQVVMSEAEHAYLFRLAMEQDRKKVASMCAIDPYQLQRLPKYQFFYAPQDGEVMGPLRLKM